MTINACFRRGGGWAGWTRGWDEVCSPWGQGETLGALQGGQPVPSWSQSPSLRVLMLYPMLQEQLGLGFVHLTS